MKRFCVVMTTDHGWRFIEPDGYSLTPDAWRAKRFHDILSATDYAHSHSFTDTDDYLEVIEVEFTTAFKFPETARRRRVT